MMEQLYQRLSDSFASGFSSEEEKRSKLQSLMDSYVSSLPQDWQRYVFFNDVHYTRNLAYATDDFELMVLCWRGHTSRVHGHSQSHCFMGVLHGRCRELVYHYLQPDGRLLSEHDQPAQVPGHCPPLQQTAERLLETGSVYYAHDSLGLHSVGTFEPVPAEAITLHLYSPPIRQTKIFEPEHNTAILRKPGFYSIDGKRV
jgi:cysteine dioxygenase